MVLIEKTGLFAHQKKKKKVCEGDGVVLVGGAGMPNLVKTVVAVKSNDTVYSFNIKV